MLPLWLDNATRPLPTLEDLDRGSYLEAVVPLDDVPVPDESDTQAQMWFAEVRIYLHQPEAAREHAQAVLQQTRDGSVRRRARCVLVECAYHEERFEEAEAEGTVLMDEAWKAGDSQATMRARYNLGRTYRRQGRHMEAIGELVEAKAMAELAGNEFYKGLCWYNIGYSQEMLGSTDLARAAYERALDLLAMSESGVYTAHCKTQYAGLLCDIREYERAQSLYVEAETAHARLGVIVGALWARNGAARTEIFLGRYTEAERRLTEVIDWQRAMSAARAEIVGLQLLSLAQFYQGRFSDAAHSAGAGSALSATMGSRGDVTDCELLAYRALGVDGSADAVAALRALSSPGSPAATRFQQGEAKIYLAECLVNSSPDDAIGLLRDAECILSGTRNERLRQDSQRLWLRLEPPIRKGPNGELILDLRGKPLPPLDEIQRAATGHAITEAMNRSGGSQKETARELQTTPAIVFNALRRLKGLPIRPGSGTKREPGRRSISKPKQGK